MEIAHLFLKQSNAYLYVSDSTEGVATVGLSMISMLLVSEASFIEGKLPIWVSINESFESKIGKSIFAKITVYDYFWFKRLI